MGSDDFPSHFENARDWHEYEIDFDDFDDHTADTRRVRENPPLEIILPVVFFVVFVIFFITCCIAAIIRKRDEERRRANITYTSPIITPGYPNQGYPTQYGGQPSLIQPAQLTTVSGGSYNNFFQQSDLPPTYEEATHLSLNSGNKDHQTGLVSVHTVPNSGQWQQQQQQQQPGWTQQ